MNTSDESKPELAIRMHIAIFSKIPLFPTNGGNRARILSLVNALKTLGHEVTFVLIPSQQLKNFDEAAHIALLGSDHFVLAKQTKLESLLKNVNTISHIISHRLRKRLYLKNYKHDNIDYIFPRFLSKSAFLSVKNRTFDCVITEYVHYSHILDFYPATVQKIIDTHDSFSAEFTERAEAEGLARANVVMAIQNKEQLLFDHILRTYFPASKTRSVLIGHFIESGTPCDLTRTSGATFLGSNFSANKVSLDWFIEAVLPKILATAPEFILYVAGTIGETLQSHPSVKILGVVPTVLDAFTDAPILLNPIQAGTGLKIKLIDAMSHGIPTVSTLKGVEGIDPDLLDGSIVVPNEDSDAFAEATLRVYRDQNLRISLGKKSFSNAQSMKADQLVALQNILRQDDDMKGN